MLVAFATNVSCTSLQDQRAIDQRLAQAPPGSCIKQRNGDYDIWDGAFWRGYHADGTPDGSITSIKRNGILEHSILYEHAQLSYHP